MFKLDAVRASSSLWFFLCVIRDTDRRPKSEHEKKIKRYPGVRPDSPRGSELFIVPESQWNNDAAKELQVESARLDFFLSARSCSITRRKSSGQSLVSNRTSK